MAAVLLAPVLRGHPGRLIGSSFALAILTGALLLRLPVARAGPGSATWLESMFTATSAVCVTGLITVDTGSYWSPFGQVVILALIQAGGLGIMTLATLVILLVGNAVNCALGWSRPRRPDRWGWPTCAPPCAASCCSAWPSKPSPRWC